MINKTGSRGQGANALGAHEFYQVWWNVMMSLFQNLNSNTVFLKLQTPGIWLRKLWAYRKEWSNAILQQRGWT